MVAQHSQSSLSVDEYLARELTTEIKHEYVRGAVYAMSGGTINHDRLANTVRAELRSHLLHRPCDSLGPDVRLRVNAVTFYYPDAMVVCDTTLEGTALDVETPCLVIEVLSDSTEAHDRGTKFANYQTLPSLQEYLLVDSRTRAVECFRRSTGDLWTYQRYEGAGTVTLQTIDLTVSLPMLYIGTGL